jgi:hypothetical protein
VGNLEEYFKETFPCLLIDSLKKIKFTHRQNKLLTPLRFCVIFYYDKHKHTKENKMRGQIETNQILSYMLAGNSTFTVENGKSSNHMTFKVTSLQRIDKDSKKELWFVKVLSGQNNETDYTFLGSLQKNGNIVFYKHSNKSRVGQDAQSVKVIEWVVNKLQQSNFPEHVHVFHEGRCGRCGRKLTVPESVTSGYGPECIQHIGG